MNLTQLDQRIDAAVNTLQGLQTWLGEAQRLKETEERRRSLREKQARLTGELASLRQKQNALQERLASAGDTLGVDEALNGLRNTSIGRAMADAAGAATITGGDGDKEWSDILLEAPDEPGEPEAPGRELEAPDEPGEPEAPGRELEAPDEPGEPEAPGRELEAGPEEQPAAGTVEPPVEAEAGESLLDETALAFLWAGDGDAAKGDDAAELLFREIEDDPDSPWADPFDDVWDEGEGAAEIAESSLELPPPPDMGDEPWPGEPPVDAWEAAPPPAFTAKPAAALTRTPQPQQKRGLLGRLFFRQ